MEKKKETCQTESLIFQESKCQNVKKENLSEVIDNKLETAILFVNNVARSSDYLSKAHKVFVKETEISIGYTNRDFVRNNQSLRAVIRTRGQVKKIVLVIQFDNEFDGAVSFSFSKHKNGVSKNDSLVLTFEALKDSDLMTPIAEEFVKKIINYKF
jgi:hypothetical protein